MSEIAITEKWQWRQLQNQSEPTIIRVYCNLLIISVPNNITLIEVYNKSKVQIHVDTPTWAWNDSIVWAYGLADIYANHKSKIKSFDQSKVRSNDNVFVTAFGHSNIDARGHSHLEAHHNVTFKAYSNATVTANDGVTGKAHDQVQVSAFRPKSIDIFDDVCLRKLKEDVPHTYWGISSQN